MHLSQKFYETYEAILLCVWVFFPFISPWKSSAFFHVLYTSYALITLKMKMSVWVRAVCIWNVHMHAFVHVLTVRMFVCTRKSDKKIELRNNNKKRLDVTEMLLAGIWENDCVYGFCLCLLWKWLLRWHGWNNIETSFCTPFML